MTIIELLVVLGILVLLVGALSAGVGRVRKSDLRADTGRLGAALRSAFDRATSTGAHHRVVIDVESSTFVLERCEGRVRLSRTLEQADEAQQALIAEQEAAMAQAQLPVGLDGTAVALPGAGAAVGGASCAPAQGALGKPQSMKTDRGIGVRRVWVAHLDVPVEEGKVTVNFFPPGRAERAVVEVANEDDDVYTLLVHPISGRVQMVAGEVRDAAEWIGRDAEGRELAVP